MTAPIQRRRRGSRPATINDVADLAEVSATTVSQALNGKGRIPPSTRDRVIAAARQLDYRPSRAARALRTQRTGTLAFLVPAFESAPTLDRRQLSLDVYMTQATAAAHTAFAHEHALLLIPPNATEPDLAAAGVDGGIVCDPLWNDQLVGLFDALGLPVVTIERDLGRPEHVWYVSADNRSSSRRLLDHLAEAGAARIAFLTVDFPIAWAIDCLEAYEAWCAENDREPLVAPTNPHQPGEDAYSKATELLDSSDPPDAILASDERYSSGVIRAADERGIAIPSELMIATAIDSHEAREASPAVTAVDIKPAFQGAAAAELLIARLAGTPVEAPRITPAELRVRASTMRRPVSSRAGGRRS
jgi:DNA-binding LacI/PurR family transcriptional regulator